MLPVWRISGRVVSRIVRAHPQWPSGDRRGRLCVQRGAVNSCILWSELLWWLSRGLEGRLHSCEGSWYTEAFRKGAGVVSGLKCQLETDVSRVQTNVKLLQVSWWSPDSWQCFSFRDGQQALRLGRQEARSQTVSYTYVAIFSYFGLKSWSDMKRSWCGL